MMRTRRRAGAAIFAATVMCLASTAAAENASPLDGARRHMRAFEYGEAISVAESVAEDRSASAHLRIEALELCGAVRLLQRQEGQARETFEQLLALDPGHEITDLELPPAVRRFYAELKARFEPETSVELTVSAPAGVQGDGPVLLHATLAGETDGVEGATAMVRTAGEGEFHSVTMTCDGEACEAEIDAPWSGGGLEYYIEVVAPSGHVLATAGSESTPELIEATESASEQDRPPVAVTTTERPSRRWYASWWFWTIVGVVVVGGATATAVVLTRPEPPPDGTLGTMQMPLLSF